MTVTLKRKNITLLLDWIYQNYAVSTDRNNCQELELLLRQEVKWMRRNKLSQVYNEWADDHKRIPSFKHVEKQVKQIITLF